MKMLFATRDHSQITEVKKKLFEAGIRCRLRKVPASRGVFGVHPRPELWIKHEEDVLKALKLLGGRRLQQMTVVLPE